MELEATAIRLQGMVADGETIGRIGEEQFAVVLPGYDADRATRFASEILVRLHEPVDASGLRLDPRASIGVAVFPGGMESA